MLIYTFKPLVSWPAERTKRPQPSRFKASWTDTQHVLERELQHLGAKQIVIQADCDESEIRRDGMLRANARLRTHGVILSFNSKHGPLSYPCDTYTKYQDNLRAIALALEALRKVDRYGVTKRAEQYRGWKQLPDPSHRETMSVESAVSMLAAHSGDSESSILNSAVSLKAAYRAGAKKLHPDKNNGNHDQFIRLGEAKSIVEQWQNGK